MSTALWIGILMFLGGVVLRFWASRRFGRAYRERHAGAAPGSWLTARSDDPEIERWRRLMIAGTVFIWVGAIVAVLNPALAV